MFIVLHEQNKIRAAEELGSVRTSAFWWPPKQKKSIPQKIPYISGN